MPERKKSLEPARVVRVESLVSPAEDAIVSRVLASSAGGTVTLFAFDTGQALSEHTTPFDALVHIIAGRMRIRIGDADVEPGPGEAVLMPADVPHALLAAEPCTMLLTMLRGTREG